MANESIIQNNDAKGNGGGVYLTSATIELYNKSKIKSNSADGKGDNVYCSNAHINLFNESEISGSKNDKYIICDECYIKEFDNDNKEKKDFCPSSHPNDNSGKNNISRGDAYLISVIIVFIVVGLIFCCYHYKNKQNKYQGLLDK